MAVSNEAFQATLDAKNAEIARLRAALKPFADSVFNDNGDMTVSMSHPTYDNYCDAYFAMRSTR